MIPLRVGFFAMFLVLGAAGCWRGPKPIETLGKAIPEGSVVVHDEATWDAVAVRYLRDSRTEGNRMEVSMELVNRSDAPVRIQVSVDFLDVAGRSTETNEVWQRMDIAPGDSGVCTSTSISGKVEKYKVHVRAQ